VADVMVGSHFISGLLQAREAADLTTAVSKGVNADCFVWPGERQAFEYITEQFDRDGSISSREMLEMDVPDFKFVEPAETMPVLTDLVLDGVRAGHIAGTLTDCVVLYEARAWDDAEDMLRAAVQEMDERAQRRTLRDPGGSWAPMDLLAAFDGSEPIAATLFPRNDGVCLLYPGMTHSFFGESESGKSLLAQIECVRLLNDGQKVLYLDFESDPVSVARRLVEFGANQASVLEHLTYLRPDADYRDSTILTAQWQSLLENRFAFAVIDGMTDAISTFGLGSNADTDIVSWHRLVARPLAERTGAAVVIIDHVTKNKETRGRFPTGSQAKLSAITGAAYVVAIEDGLVLGKGRLGVMNVAIAKDRLGAVRGADEGQSADRDRAQPVARVVVDSTGSSPVVEIWPARMRPGAGSSASTRPTGLMERVSDYIQTNPGMNKTSVKTAVTGKAEFVVLALDLLIAEGYVTATDGPKRSTLLAPCKPYLQSGDPKSDRYSPEDQFPDATW
jgi:hypothetical protein